MRIKYQEHLKFTTLFNFAILCKVLKQVFFIYFLLRMIRRFTKQLNDTKEYPIPYVHILSHVHDPETGITAQAKLIAPQNSLYQHQQFDIEIKVPKDYPFRPPKIAILTKIYHPNVYQKNGNICCCTIPELKDNWSPAYTIPKMLAKIVEMIEDPDRYLSDCGDQETIQLYKEKREEFNRKAKQFSENKGEMELQ